jgi:hypothetical protein
MGIYSQGPKVECYIRSSAQPVIFFTDQDYRYGGFGGNAINMTMEVTIDHYIAHYQDTQSGELVEDGGNCFWRHSCSLGRKGRIRGSVFLE